MAFTELRAAAKQALEALEADCGGRCNVEYNPCWQREAAETLRAALVEDALQKFTDVSQEIEAALAEPVQDPVCAHGVGKTKCSFCSVEDKQPVQEPVAGRAFLERILAAMEGVIDVADRKTYEFDALRSCVIDLTLMLHTAPPQRPAEPVQDPVAWIHTDPNMPRVKFLEWRENEPGYRGDWIKTPLYAAPPQRKPLTEEELEVLEAKYAPPVHPNFSENDDWLAFARAIERAHGIDGAPEERNFCSRCGKRANGIHTCTPPAPLTDEVIAELWHQNGGFHHHFARAIERWLKGNP